MTINPISGKVNSGTLTSPSPTATGKTGNGDKAEKAATPEQVDVSAVAGEIRQAIESAGARDSLVNLEKVEKIKQLLLNGDYRIDADSIADKMIELDRHL